MYAPVVVGYWRGNDLNELNLWGYPIMKHADMW